MGNEVSYWELEVFGEKIKRASEVLPEASREFISRNVLTNLFYWDPKEYPDRYAFLTFLGLCSDKGHTFRDVVEKLYPLVDKNKVIKYAERSLDVLRDAGLVYTRWENQDGKYTKKFFPTEELRGFSKYAGDIGIIYDADLRKSIFKTEEKEADVLLPLIINLWMGFPDKYSFSRRVLDSCLYMAYIGDIGDSNQKLELELKEPIYYKDIWKIFSKFSDCNIYDSNIRFCSPRKKLGIYDLDIEALEDIIIQSKLRFALNVDENEFDDNLPIKSMTIVPEVNCEASNRGIYELLESELLLKFLRETEDELRVKKINLGGKKLEELVTELKKDRYELGKIDFSKDFSPEVSKKLVLKEIRDKNNKTEIDFYEKLTKQIEEYNPKVLVTSSERVYKIVNHLNWSEKIKIESIDELTKPHKKVLVLDYAIDSEEKLRRILEEIKGKMSEKDWNEFKNDGGIFTYVAYESAKDKIFDVLRDFDLKVDRFYANYWLS